MRVLLEGWEGDGIKGCDRYWKGEVMEGIKRCVIGTGRMGGVKV